MLTIQEICDECQPLAYRFGRDLFLKDAFVRVSTEYSKETMECVISGKVRDTIWQEAWVALDIEDRITDYNCGCSNSKSFKGMCRHCAALTLKYRQLCLKPGWNKQANGEDAEGTSEQNVKTGVLLKNLLNRFDSTEIVAVTAGGSVHLYPKVESDGGKYHLALSIGNDRKKYTVNNIYHFLYMTETRAFERYGRHLSFTHDRSAFSENALSLIDFMMAYLKTVKDGFKTEDLLSFPASSVLSLNNYGMDELLVLYLGSSLELNNCIYEIVEKPPILDVLFEPVEGGVEISIGMVKVFDGARHGYIFMDRKIYQCPEDYMHTLWPVLKSLGVFSGSETGRVYKEILSFKDYGIFCSFLWPMMEKYMDMTLGRELLSDFFAKDAQFNVYIGLGSGPDFAITMKAEAVYDDRVCPLAKINEPTVGYRNWEAERHMVRLLYKYFVCEDDLYPGTGVCRSDDDIVRLLNEGIDDLNQYAQVFVDERVRKIKVISAARLNVGVSIRSGILDFDVRANDMSWEEIREALKAYRRKKKYFRLRNGDFIALGNDGLAVVSRLAKDMSVDLNTVSDGSIQVPVFRSGYVDKVLSEAQEHIELHKSRDFRKLIRELGHISTDCMPCLPCL